MPKYWETEIAYKNGYEQGIKDLIKKIQEHVETPEFPQDYSVVATDVIQQAAEELINEKCKH